MSDGGTVVRECTGGVVVEVLASAGSATSKVRGLHGSALKVAVRAAPEKGKANAEVEELLAAFFGVSKSQVSVAAGQTSRKKRILVAGITAAQALERIRTLGA
jgi:uncharacterized protein (TIGR00251 family)